MKKLNNKNQALIASLITVGLLTSCLKQNEDIPVVKEPTKPPATVSYNWERIADSAQTSLPYFYNASGSFYQTANNNTNWVQYWPSAHTLDVLLDAYSRNPLEATKVKMDNLLTGMKAQNGNTWLNYYYDDMEWMALACLRAYQLTNDAKYKDIFDILWVDIKGGYSTDLGGGLWWRKDYQSKNTPSNMPAAIFAARLYKQFNRADDLKWATDLYNWQKSTLYEPTSGWVYDNIEKNGNKNTVWKFTYNQGTFLGAALELYKITNNPVYLNDAIKAADFAVSSGQLLNNSILKDEGGGDGGLFKGVFVRYFTRLIVEGNLEAGKKTEYINFLKRNGESLWSKATNKNFVFFGSAWDVGPGNSVDLTVQLSGIMLCETLAELQKKELLK